MDLLVQLGLLPQEATVYRAVLQNAAISPFSLAQEVGLNPDELASIIQGLIDKELVYRVVQPDHDGTVVVCNDPADAFAERIEEHARAVEAAREELKRLRAQHQSSLALRRGEAPVELLHADDVAVAWMRVQRAADTVVRLVDRPPYVTPNGEARGQPHPTGASCRGRRLQGDL